MSVSTSQERITPVELTVLLASARQLSYLFVKDPAHLEVKDHQILTFIIQEKELELSYRLTQQIIYLMKNQQAGEPFLLNPKLSSCFQRAIV